MAFYIVPAYYLSHVKRNNHIDIFVPFNKNFKALSTQARD